MKIGNLISYKHKGEMKLGFYGLALIMLFSLSACGPMTRAGGFDPSKYDPNFKAAPYVPKAPPPPPPPPQKPYNPVYPTVKKKGPQNKNCCCCECPQQ